VREEAAKVAALLVVGGCTRWIFQCTHSLQAPGFSP
jgi:hypothetical protein